MLDFDTKIEELRSAVEDLRQKWKDSGYTTEDLKRLTATEKELEQAMKKKDEAETGDHRFKNIEQTAAWIIGAGYLVAARTVRNHAERPGFPKKQKDGTYLKSEIEVYAAANWENPGKADQKDDEITAGNANDRLKIAMAEERELRNKKLRGELIDAAEEEARDARLWSAVRAEIENQAPTVVNDLVESVLALGPEEEFRRRILALVPALKETYENSIADIFDRFAQEGGVTLEL